jgi:CRP-like cAMP-binding protein
MSRRRKGARRCSWKETSPAKAASAILTIWSGRGARPIMIPPWRRKPLWRRGAEGGRPIRNADNSPSAAEKLWYVQHVDLFQGMTPREMRRLAQRTQMRRYQRGDVIAHPDDPPEGIYLIKEGRVKLCRYADSGRIQTLALLERGNIFGERALLGAPVTVSCEAFEDTVICVLRRQDFEELIQSKPDLALRVMKVLAERLHQAEDAIENLGLHGVPQRLATLLVRLAEAYGEPHEQNGGRRLALRLTHHELASMVGATRETVTIALNRFRDDGLITIEDRHIVIRDAQRLTALE